jgi:hypothetical protein
MQMGRSSLMVVSEQKSTGKFFVGVGSILVGSTYNGIGTINVGNSNQFTLELNKPLASGDSAGADID